jgi:hypothetical protein
MHRGTKVTNILTRTQNGGLVDAKGDNMKTIRISDEVWQAIADLGKFGETEDDVLRRVFRIQKPQPDVSVVKHEHTAIEEHQNGRAYAWKERRADVAMYQRVEGGKLILEFETGQREEWKLPSQNDAAAIRKVRDEAVGFVRKNGGTEGQVGAAMRALTSRGYHVTLKSKRQI